MSISGPKLILNNDISSSLKSLLSHIDSNGSSHSFIDQDVTINSDPTFNSITLSNTNFTINNQAVTLGYFLDEGSSASVAGGVFISGNSYNAFSDNLTIFVTNNVLSLSTSLAGNGLTGSFPISVQPDTSSIEINSNQLRIASGTAGNGITGGSGTALSLQPDTSSTELSSNELRVASGVAGNGLSGGGGSDLVVQTDTNSIEINSNQLRIASGIAGNGITGGSGTALSLQPDTTSTELNSNELRIASGVAGNGLTGGSGSDLVVQTDTNSIEINTNQLRISSGIAGNGITGGSGTALSLQPDTTSTELSSNELRIASGVAGNGLGGGSGSDLVVQTDTNSIEINTNQLRIASGIAGNGITGGSGTALSLQPDTTTTELSSNQLRIASGVAGGGLIGGSGSDIEVGQGTGITVNASDISVNSNQSHVTQLGNLTSLVVTGNVSLNSNLVVRGESDVINGNVVGSGVLLKNPGEELYYTTVTEGLNRLSLNGGKIYVNTTSEFISALSSISGTGGIIELAPRTFEVTTTAFSVPSDTIIQGKSQGSTVLRKAQTNNTINILELDSNTVVRNLTIDCNNQENGNIIGNAHGIYYEGGKSKILIDSIEVKNFGDTVIPLFGGDNTNTTTDLTIQNSNVSSSISTGNIIYGNYENSRIIDSYFRKPEGGFFKSGQVLSNVSILSNFIEANVQSRVDTIGNCSLTISKNTFHGSSIDINSLNTGTTGATAEISVTDNYFDSERGAQILTLLGSNTSCNYRVSSNYFKGDYRLIHNNGTVNYSTVDSNMFNRKDVNEIEPVMDLTTLSNAFISANVIKNSNVSANCIIYDTLDSGCVLSKNFATEYKSDPDFISGTADIYYITTTTATTCYIGYLNVASKGHRIELILQTDGGDLTLRPYHFINGDKLTFDTVGDRCVLEWDGYSWVLVNKSGGEIEIETISNVAITNIDTISTVKSQISRESEVFKFSGTFEVTPNTTSTTTDFTFDLPANFSLTANTDFIGLSSGYNIDDNDISDLFVRGNTDGNRSNVYCSFTSVGDVKKHNINIMGYYPGNILVPGQILEQRFIQGSGSVLSVPTSATEFNGTQASFTFDSQHEIMIIETNLAFYHNGEQDYVGAYFYKDSTEIYSTFTGMPDVSATLFRNFFTGFSDRPGTGTFEYNIGTIGQVSGTSINQSRIWVKYTRMYLPISKTRIESNNWTF